MIAFIYILLFILFEVCSACCICIFLSFAKFGKFSSHYFFKYLFSPAHFLLSFKTQMWGRGVRGRLQPLPREGLSQANCVGPLCLSQDLGASTARRASEVPGQEGENQTELAAPGQPRGPRDGGLAAKSHMETRAGLLDGMLPLRLLGECLRLELMAVAGVGEPGAVGREP